ncbi:MAG: GAF domain-containing protein [Chloroflexota bacterium]
MKPKIKILFVGDNKSDARLIVREIKKAGYQVSWEISTTEDDILKNCQAKTWDLTIIDYSVSGLGGLYVLEILKTAAPYLPSIVVSDVMGEDVAVASMKAGADDYLIKGQYSHLIPAVESALSSAKVRANKVGVDEALRFNEQRYRTLIENSPLAIVVYHEMGIAYVNQVCVDLAGAASADDLIGRSPLDFIHPDHHDLVREHMDLASSSGLPPVEEILIRVDGDTFNAEIVSSPIDFQGQPAILSIISNITERHQSEKELENFTHSLEHRAMQLQVAAEVARDTARFIDLEQLLNRAVNLLQRRFGFYFAGIYFVEENNPYAVLAAATGDAGEAMLADQHKLRIGDVGIVGHVAASGKPRIAPNVNKDTKYLTNPSLPDTRSEMALPLMVGDETIGVIDVQSQEENAFGQDDLQILKILADQIAIAIENARLFEVEFAARERTEALREAAQLINSTLSLDQIIETVLEQLGRVLPYDSGCVITLDDNQAIVRAGLGYEKFSDAAPVSSFMFDLEDETVGHVLRTGKPLMLDNTNQDARWVTTPISGHVNSWLGVPLLARDQTIGLLSLDRVSEQGFSDQEIEVAQIFALHSAAAIDNARLFEAVETRAAELETERRYLGMLYDISKSIVLSTDPHHILQQAVKLICQVLSGTSGVALIYDLDTELLNPVAIYDSRTGYITDKGPGLALGEGLAGWVAKESQSVNIPDVRADKRWSFMPETDQGIHSAICAPILDGQNVIGTLSVQHTQANAFNSDHLSILEAICLQVAIAFHNAKRYQAIDHLVDRLGSQQYRLESLIKELPVGVILLSRLHNLITANALGHEYIAELADVAEDDQIISLGQYPILELLSLQDGDSPVEISTADEPGRQFEVHARLIHADQTNEWLLTIREVTEERKIQERVQMQDRLATVGQLAAGIAHDFNNIMAAIVVYADLLKMDSGLSLDSEERITIIQDQVQRASSLIRQILDFSRRSVMENVPLNLLPFLKEFEKLLRRMLPETITTRLIYNAERYMVSADLTRLQQVLMNLAVNARDAMIDGGTLEFELDTLTLSDGESHPQGHLNPGKWVRLSITDTGVGITPEDQPHVFEPFFTTKDVGKGTGLGLAQVYGIIKQHDGYIYVESHPDQGTTFNIYLPELIEDQISKGKQEESLDLSGDGKKVILAEDDAATRAAVQDLLEAHQFEVLAVSNGTETLRILERNTEKIALIVSDIVMPEMGGVELSKIVAARWPDIKILFITGHPLEDEDQTFLSTGQFAWIKKPFSVQTLSHEIQKLLGVDR